MNGKIGSLIEIITFQCFNCCGFFFCFGKPDDIENSVEKERCKRAKNQAAKQRQEAIKCFILNPKKKLQRCWLECTTSRTTTFCASVLLIIFFFFARVENFTFHGSEIAHTQKREDNQNSYVGNEKPIFIFYLFSINELRTIERKQKKMLFLTSREYAILRTFLQKEEESRDKVCEPNTLTWILRDFSFVV